MEPHLHTPPDRMEGTRQLPIAKLCFHPIGHPIPGDLRQGWRSLAPWSMARNGRARAQESFGQAVLKIDVWPCLSFPWQRIRRGWNIEV